MHKAEGNQNPRENSTLVINSSFVMQVCILTENEEWDSVYHDALVSAGAKVSKLRISDAVVFDFVPDADVYFNRYSPSASWRGRADATVCAMAWLEHLELSGARVFSGTSALRLEQSKVAQHAACIRAGFRCPSIVACAGNSVANVVKTWSPAGERLVIKPDCGGSGRDVCEAVSGFDTCELSDNQLFVVQKFIDSAQGTLTRMEFVNGKLLYALKVRVDAGSYDNCPSDACLRGNCPMQRDTTKFNVDKAFPSTREDHAAVGHAQTLIAMFHLDIVGIEMIKDLNGKWWVIDCNCVNTNYNRAAELKANSVSGVNAVVNALLD